MCPPDPRGTHLEALLYLNTALRDRDVVDCSNDIVHTAEVLRYHETCIQAAVRVDGEIDRVKTCSLNTSFPRSGSNPG